MSNIKDAPLFLTPQAVRESLGIGHAKNMIDIKVEGKVNHNDKRDHNWMLARRERLNRAIAYLKTQCILVQIIDRQSPIRQYGISGKRAYFLADGVIEYALLRGWVE